MITVLWAYEGWQFRHLQRRRGRESAEKFPTCVLLPDRFFWPGCICLRWLLISLRSGREQPRPAIRLLPL